MLCSNHEKIRFGSKIRWMFWSRKGRTQTKLYVESGDTAYARSHFKGRKPRTWKDMRKVEPSLED